MAAAASPAPISEENDFIERLYVASTHTYMLIFTDDGPLLLAQGARIAAGRSRHARQADRQPDQRHARYAHPRDRPHARVLATPSSCCSAPSNGTVKKTALSQYSNPRTTGIKAIKIEEDDELIDVQVTSGNNDVVLATKHGLSVRFHESDVREMGRDTTGVKGIELRPTDQVVGMVVIKRESTLLVVTEKGLGKCSEVERVPRAEARRQGHPHAQPHGEDR